MATARGAAKLAALRREGFLVAGDRVGVSLFSRCSVSRASRVWLEVACTHIRKLLKNHTLPAQLKLPSLHTPHPAPPDHARAQQAAGWCCGVGGVVQADLAEYVALQAKRFCMQGAGLCTCCRGCSMSSLCAWCAWPQGTLCPQDAGARCRLAARPKRCWRAAWCRHLAVPCRCCCLCSAHKHGI